MCSLKKPNCHQRPASQCHFKRLQVNKCWVARFWCEGIQRHPPTRAIQLGLESKDARLVSLRRHIVFQRAGSAGNILCDVQTASVEGREQSGGGLRAAIAVRIQNQPPVDFCSTCIMCKTWGWFFFKWSTFKSNPVLFSQLCCMLCYKKDMLWIWHSLGCFNKR